MQILQVLKPLLVSQLFDLMIFGKFEATKAIYEALDFSVKELEKENPSYEAPTSLPDSPVSIVDLVKSVAFRLMFSPTATLDYGFYVTLWTLRETILVQHPDYKASAVAPTPKFGVTATATVGAAPHA